MGEPKDGDAAKWKLANEMVTATINFAIATAGSKIRGRGEERAMISNRNQNDKATKGPNAARPSVVVGTIKEDGSMRIVYRFG